MLKADTWDIAVTQPGGVGVEVVLFKLPNVSLWRLNRVLDIQTFVKTFLRSTLRYLISCIQ